MKKLTAITLLLLFFGALGNSYGFKPKAFSFQGFRGIVYEKDNIKVPIPDAKITFRSEKTNYETVVFSNEGGFYEVYLDVGRYYVKVEHFDYETYTTGSGFFVVPKKGEYMTGNFFLTKKQW